MHRSSPTKQTPTTPEIKTPAANYAIKQVPNWMTIKEFNGFEHDIYLDQVHRQTHEFRNQSPVNPNPLFYLSKRNFTARFVDAGLEVVTPPCNKVLQHADITNILWLNLLNQLITFSPTAIKIWSYVNGDFQEIKNYRISGLSSNCHDENGIRNLQISSDNRLLAANQIWGLCIFLCDLLTGKWMLKKIEPKYSAMYVISSSKIALEYTTSEKWIIDSYNVCFDKKCIAKAESSSFDRLRWWSKAHELLADGKTFIGTSDNGGIEAFNFATKSKQTLYPQEEKYARASLEYLAADMQLLLSIHFQTVLTFQIIDVEKQNYLKKTLEDTLAKFSLDVVGVVASYCDFATAYKAFDFRMLAPSIPFDLCCKMQRYIFDVKKDPDPLRQKKVAALELLLYLSVNEPEKTMQQHIEKVMVEYPEATRGGFSKVAGFFKQLKTIPAKTTSVLGMRFPSPPT